MSAPAPRPGTMQQKRNLIRTPIRRTMLKLLLLLAACRDDACPDGTVNPDIVATGDASLTASPSVLRVPLGGAGIVTLTSSAALASVGAPAPVLPGVVVAFPAQSIAAGGTMIATVTVSASAALGGTDDFVVATSTRFSPGFVFEGKPTVRLEVLEPFSITTAPAVSGRAGQVIARQIIVERTQGFTAPIAFSFTGLPDGATAVSGTVPTDPISSVPYTITTLSTTPTRVYNAQLVATGNGVTRSVPVAINIDAPLPTPDFSLQLSPSTLTVDRNGTYAVDVNLTPNAAVTDPVVLSFSTLPAGVTGSFASISSTVARLTLVAADAGPVTNRNVIVTGVASGITRTATLSLTVLPPPDFTLVANPALLVLHGVVSAASPVSGQLTITRTGTVGDVILDTQGLPDGIGVAFNPATVSGNTSTVSFTSNGAVSPATYSVTIRGTNAGLQRTTIMQLKVEAADGDFTAEFRPSTATLMQGETGTLSLALSRTGVLVDAPITITGVVGPPALQMIPVAPTTSGVTFVSFLVDNAIPAGNYPLTVRATGGFVAHEATANITVIPRMPDFTLSSLPTQFELPRGEFTPFSIVVNPRGGFGGLIQFSAVNPLPGNMIIEFVTNPTSAGFVTVRMYASPNVTPGPYTVRFTGSSGTLVRTVDVTVIVKP